VFGAEASSLGILPKMVRDPLAKDKRTVRGAQRLRQGLLVLSCRVFERILRAASQQPAGGPHILTYSRALPCSRDRGGVGIIRSRDDPLAVAPGVTPAIPEAPGGTSS